MLLSEIFIYPIKALGGIALPAATVEPRGLQYDRRWMLVDEFGMFFTQREIPELTFFQTEIKDSFLIIKREGMGALAVPLEMEEHPASIPVQIWEDHCMALPLQKEVDDWFCEALQRKCRLVYMPDSTHRQTDLKYSQPGEIVSFADGYPFLIIGQASLEDLNARLQHKITIHRFRPNFVFTGGTPFEEDTWKRFSIGKLHFRAVKPCARCQVITVDLQTATFGKEPLRTLSSYRLDGHKILFGMNVCWDIENNEDPRVRIGDAIEVLA